MKRKSVRYGLLVACVALGACGETDLVMSELSELEAQDLAGAVMFATFNSTPESAPAPAGGPQMAPYEYQSAIDTEVACPLGGVVGVMADVLVVGDTESEAGSLDFSMTHVHDGCVVQSENDRLFTLWGAPSMALDLLVENNGQGVVEWGGSVTGAIDWATDGRMGTCEVALEFSARVEGDTAFDAEMAGAVCGFNVSRSLTVGGAQAS